MEKSLEIKESVQERTGEEPSAYRKALEMELKRCVDRITENLQIFTGGTMPGPSSEKNVYPVYTNVDWTASFWCGMLWLAFEYTDNESFKKQALVQCESFRERYEKKIGMETHDIGFLYTLSCVAGYKLTGEEWLRDLAVRAASVLMTRYKQEFRYIQSWGDNGDDEFCMLIVDSLMNLPLLFWAGEETGNLQYTNAAREHAMTCGKYVLRADGSTYHAFYFEPKTGKPVSGRTAQGYADNSTWARGQAWAIYGFSLAYCYEKNPFYLECAEKACNYFLGHLKEDYLCYWDLSFNIPCNELIDSSATAIAVCGMLNLMNLPCSENNKQKYCHVVKNMLYSLYKKCSARHDKKSNGLLLHGVYSIPHRLGVDECCIWGDYFYMEALVRLWKENRWNQYW